MNKLIFKDVVLPLALCLLAISIAAFPSVREQLMVVYWLLIAIRATFWIDIRLIKKKEKEDFNRVWLRRKGSQVWIGPFDNMNSANSYMLEIGSEELFYIMTNWDYFKELMSNGET